jgi:hypothetical protein
MARARILGIGAAGFSCCAGLCQTALADANEGVQLALQAPPPTPGPLLAPSAPPARAQPTATDESGSAPTPPEAAEPVASSPEPSPATPPQSAQSPSTEAVADPAVATNGTMSAEDAAALAALEAEVAASSSEVGLEEAQFSLYGFADFTYLTQLGKTSVTSSPYSSFMVGNFNVYFSTEFERHWRSLAEVRFLYLPHGAQAGTDVLQIDPNRIDTSVVDGSNFQRVMRWGGVAIQRVWLEYNFNDYLTVRAGQWLTPYGIWVVDHGSPTIISVHRPYMIDQAWFPEQQTGIEAYGAFYIEDTKLGYHLTLSNGRGLVDSYQDLDNNKGVGARLYLQNDSLLGAFSLGISGYRGAYTARATNGFGVTNGELVTVDPPTAKFDELDLAADLKWEWGGLLVQSEFILTDVRYPDALRPPAATSTPGPPGVQPDWRRYGVYGLVGYRMPWWNVMPYVLLQRIHDAYSAQDYIAGINARPSARVTLKAEYEYVDFPTTAGVKLENLSVLALQMAWSF